MDSATGNRSEIAVAVEELKAAGVFLTRVPARYFGVDPSFAPDFRTAARTFPVVGALVGLVGGIVLAVALALGLPALVAAALAIGTTTLLTGGLHEDGLADLADSFGGATTEQKLQIMDDSRIGTFGGLAIGFSILLRVVALGAIAAHGPLQALLVLVAAEAVGRAALVRLWHDLPAAKLSGLAHDTGPPDQNAMLIALAIAAVIAVVLCLPTIGLWATVLAGALAAIATYLLIRQVARSLGGRTGDTLGACEQVAVIAFLVGASAF